MSRSKLHSFFKTVASMLSIIIAFYSVPSSVWAFDPVLPESEPETTESESVSPYNGTIIEVEENRSLSDKTFRLSDGSFYTAHYNTEIHEYDANGRLADIDNRLFISNGFITTENGKKTFPEYPSSEYPVFSLASNDTSVSFTLEGNVNTSARGGIYNKETKFEEGATDLDRLITLDRILSAVTYKDVLPKTDIEYVLYGSDVKENVIFKAVPEDGSVSFILSLDGLLAKLSEDGEITVSNEKGEFRYRIPRPVMWDADDSFSDSIETSLEQLSEREYRLTYTPDAEWLNAPEREYPVTLDPSVYSHSSNVIDLDLNVNNPTGNSPGDSSIYVSSTWRAYWKMTSLISLPSHCKITNATITLNCFTANAVLDGYVGVYDVTSDWTSSLTWQNVTNGTAGVPASTFTDYCRIQTFNPDGNGYYLPDPEFSWNVTPIVNKWYEGENYGMMFQPATETFTGIAQFRSNDYSTSSVRPQLSVTYVDMKGIEDYWTYTSQDAGFAGTGYVNNATGNLVWTIPTLTTTDALMPISPALVYNFCTDFADYCYPNVQSANVYSMTAKGFKLNLNETLVKKQFQGPNNTTMYYFIWADGDGTEHYFLNTGHDENWYEYYYEDEDGLLLKLTECVEGEEWCRITDSDHTVRTFYPATTPTGLSGAYVLNSIRDKNGNRVEIYTPYFNRPTRISLVPYDEDDEGPSFTQLKLMYNSLGKLYCVYNPNSGEGVVFRYSAYYESAVGTGYGGFLRQTVRAHGGTTDIAWENFYNTNSNSNYGGITVDAVADYTYNYLGLLAKVTNNLTGYKAGYSTYYSKRICSVYEQAGADNTQGQELYYQYGTSSTRIQSSGTDDIFDNSDDIWTTFVFDGAGRCFNSYTTDIDSTVMYGASGGQYVGNENAKAKNKIKSSVVTTQHSSNYLLNGGFDGGSGIPYWTTSESVSLAYTNEPVGAKALSLKLTGSVSQSTAYQYVDLSKGDYTLSADFSTSSFPSGVTVYLNAESTVNSAHSVTKRIPVNRYFASDGIYTEALQFSAVPSVSGGTERFKISIVLSGSVSSDTALTVDNVMLSKTRGSAEYDLVSSGHFEANYGISPTSLWTLPYESGNIVTADSGNPLFGKVLKVDYAPEQFPVVTQTVYQAPQSLRDDFDGEVYTENKPVMFTVSGWAKGTGQSYSDEANFCIDLNIQYYTGSGHYSSRTETVEFDRGITDWQFASDGFMSSYSDRMIDSVTILIYYIGHGRIGYFDDISVTIDSSTTTVNTYNNSGYLTKSRNGKGALSLTYNSNNDVVRSVNSGSRTVVDYEYYTNGSIWKKTQSKYTGNAPSSNNLLGICRTTYNYNTCGLVTEVLYEDLENTSLQTHTNVAYYTSEAPHIYGTVKSETDVLGNVTRYFHDAQTGRLSAVIYPNGKGTTYTYDGMGRITSILPATFSGSSYSQITTGARTQYGYDSAGRLSSITTRTGTTATTTYGFTYDVFGKGTGVSVGNRQIASCEYNTQNGKLNKLVYGNGLNVKYVYDEYERISEIEYRNGNSGSFTTAFKYTYDADGNLYSIEDVENHEITVNDFDASGSLRSSVTYNSSNYCNKYRGHYYYDDESRISEMYDSFDCKVGSGYYQAGNCYWFEYTNTGNLEELEIYDVNYSAKIDPQYDNLGRANTRSITAGTSGTAHHFYNSISFSYALSGTYSTGRVSQLNSVIKKSPNSPAVSDQTYNYTYDQNGNITSISGASGQTLYRYEYDALGQLTREDNLPLGKSYTYTYDLNGNRTSKTTYAFTTGSLGTAQSTVSYAHGDSGWKDLLTSFGNTSVSYDNCGNPTSIGYYSLTWKGRQLKTRYDGEYETLTFGYNADGVRVYKEEYEEEPGYTVRHEYTLSGSRIVKETVFYDGSEIFTLIYTYDENGSPIGYRFRRPNYAANVYDNYYFDKNLQGDIVAVYGSDGDLLVDYKYDAWGKCFAEYSDEYDDEYWDAPGEYFNPFRYRGYYYDEETGWYYLQSRYYNPEWGRFINADGQLNGGLLGNNQFAYCENSPVLYIDRYGMKRYRDPDEPDWASMFTVSQLEKIHEIGIDEFDNYPDNVQDAILYDALVGQLPNQVTLDDLDSFYTDYSNNNIKNKSLFSNSYAYKQARQRMINNAMESSVIGAIPGYGIATTIISIFNNSLYSYYGNNALIIDIGLQNCVFYFAKQLVIKSIPNLDNIIDTFSIAKEMSR